MILTKAAVSVLRRCRDPGDEPRPDVDTLPSVLYMGQMTNSAAVTASCDCCQLHPRRLGAKVKVVQVRLGALGIPVTVLSMMPLRDLESCRRRTTVALWTTWNDAEPHESYAYHPPG